MCALLKDIAHAVPVVLGRTEERLARTQETYIEAASTSWLDSLERSLVQMKEYQAARKKLEQRRLAYDTSLAKLQRAKKEDFRAEEELRSQKAKYEDAEDEVHRRMGDIRDNDPQNVSDLGMFLEAQLEYHDKCRAALLQLQAEWPATYVDSRRDLHLSCVANSFRRTQAAPSRRPNARSRSSTIRSYTQPEPEPEPIPEIRPTIRSNTSRTISANTLRPGFNRSTTYDSPAQPRRDMSPAHSTPLARVPSDSLMIKTARLNLRNNQDSDVFADESSADQSYDDRATSPATSNGSSSAMLGGKRAPPPPPPSRSKKPPPPPVPQKRASVIY
jgi:hypothetical protein